MQQTQDLRRPAFFEILLRIAAAKYRDTGFCNSYHESLSYFFKDYVIPMTRDASTITDKFRETEIWTLDVNDILQTNLINLKKLYNTTASRIKEKYFNLRQAINLIQEDSHIKLLERDIIACFSYSKMTVLDDDDRQSYIKLGFVEFLDFLCRISDLGIKQEDQSLS